MKKTGAFILSALLMLGCVNVNALTLDEAKSNIWKTYHAAFDYEKAGDYDAALLKYNKFIEYANYLEDNAGESHWENIKGLGAIANHLSTTSELYVEAQNPYDSKYFGAKYEPRYGAFFGKCNTFDEERETAYLLYTRFGTENIGDFGYLLPENKDIYLELAWNVPNENKSDLDLINSGAMDEYIISNLKYVGTLKQKVLLRFGAEVNCWAIPEEQSARLEFIESYKSAFRRIADLARRHAPNAAMVYSPNDISNWYVTAEDFYPGDEYVDWVGMSMYSNLSRNTKFERANTNDAYYCHGYYDNPIVKIKNIVDSFGDRKPLFISECGFAYSGDGLQNLEHATEKLKDFYSYVTMVYPQVKGVMFFNTNFGGMNYSLNDCLALKEAYDEVTASNLSFGALKMGTQKGYTRFSTLNEKTDTLNIHLFVQYPSEHETSVAFKVDGAAIPHKNEPTYSASVDVSGLSIGKHILTVAVSNGTYYKATDYEFYVGPGNFVGQSADVLENAVSDKITVTINGEPIIFDIEPVNDSGRVLVPLRKIFDSLGADVDWIGETKTIVSTKGNKKIVMQIGNNEMHISDSGESSVITLDVPAKLIGGATMVPVRAISNGYDCDVEWDQDTKTVKITTN